MIYIAMLLQLIGWLLTVVGGFAAMGALLYGIYALFAKSIAGGLMIIGGAVVGTFLLNVLRASAFAASDTIARRGIRSMEASNGLMSNPSRGNLEEDDPMLKAMGPMLATLAERVSTFRLAGMPKSEAMNIALSAADGMDASAKRYLRSTVEHVYRLPDDALRVLASEAERKDQM